MTPDNLVPEFSEPTSRYDREILVGFGEKPAESRLAPLLFFRFFIFRHRIFQFLRSSYFMLPFIPVGTSRAAYELRPRPSYSPIAALTEGDH